MSDSIQDWDVYLYGELLATVGFPCEYESSLVYRILVIEDEYDSDIEVFPV